MLLQGLRPERSPYLVAALPHLHGDFLVIPRGMHGVVLITYYYSTKQLCS
jgi:hypothetical protein